nr:hypothetical protein Iba_chr13eCG8060 [Ipomoea batatas]
MQSNQCGFPDGDAMEGVEQQNSETNSGESVRKATYKDLLTGTQQKHPMVEDMVSNDGGVQLDDQHSAAFPSLSLSLVSLAVRAWTVTMEDFQQPSQSVAVSPSSITQGSGMSPFSDAKQQQAVVWASVYRHFVPLLVDVTAVAGSSRSARFPLRPSFSLSRRSTDQRASPGAASRERLPQQRWRTAEHGCDMGGADLSGVGVGGDMRFPNLPFLIVPRHRQWWEAAAAARANSRRTLVPARTE